MVVLFAQEREEIHLREYVGDFAQVFPAEVRNNAAGGRVPQRGSLVNLVLANQHNTACVDDVGGILDKIAAAALNLIVNLILMVDVETGHLVAGIAVNVVNKKVHMGRVDIFRNHNACSLLPRCHAPGDWFLFYLLE